MDDVHKTNEPTLITMQGKPAAKLAPAEIVRQDQTDILQMQRHEFWRFQYRSKRYARHLSQSELNRRIRDVLLNILRLTADAKIGVPPIDKNFVVWLEKWTHVIEEMRLRHGPYPSGFTREILHSEPFPNFASDLAAKAARKLSALGLKKNEVLIKFGKSTHMSSLYESGALRIQPASFFKQQHHTGAIKDDELTLPLSLVLSRDEVVKVVINPQDVPPDAQDQRVDVQFHASSDYWLYCVTNSVEPRLFVDFEADACVIIRDRKQFSQMLRKASHKNLGEVSTREGPAIYVDPLLPRSANIFVPLSKYFGYSYQEEYRFCWLPSKPVKELTHVDVQIGSLKEIAELIVL
jgi:hypothetical protein